MKDKILLFIPMYNCEKQIVRVLTQITFDVCKYLTEIIVVNNQSMDNGEQIVKNYFVCNSFPIPVKLLRNRQNYGLGGSHKIAFFYAIKHGFDYVIVLHGDDQGQIMDIVPYLSDGKYRQFDSLLGSRFMKKSELINYSGFRIFGNHVFNLFFSGVTGRRITDLGSGLNLYKVDYLKGGFYAFFPNSLSFNVYMLLYGVFSESRFAFFPLSWREEDQASNAKFFRQSIEFLHLAAQYVFCRKRLFSMKENKYSQIDYTYDVIYGGMK